MKRRPAPPDGALFDAPDRDRGATERAVERSLTLWRAAGRDVDPISSRMLRVQGHAVDLATVKADAWQIGNATRILLELLQGLGLVATAAADPMDAMLAQLMADDDTPPVRDTPPA